MDTVLLIFIIIIKAITTILIACISYTQWVSSSHYN